MANDTCTFCSMVAGHFPAQKVFENDTVMAVLAPAPAAYGHLLVMPKQHFPIIEQVPDFVMGEMLLVCNKLSTAVFETLGSTGTNIIVQNGIAAGQTAAHCMAHILPRRENDNLNFQWQPRQLSEEQLSTVELQITEFTQGIGHFDKKEPEKEPEATSSPPSSPQPTRGEEHGHDHGHKHDEESLHEDEEEENYILKQLQRIP
ncbi:HIT family protein [Candidatus Woesearchaeota archaeon]|nr:HIT family protein [Candidatus Woesearchaeota archaeon]